MQLWQDGVVALLAAIGLASLVWTAVRAVLFAGPERRREIGLVLPAQGDGERLEEQLRFLDGLRRERGCPAGRFWWTAASPRRAVSWPASCRGDTAG